MTRLQKLDVSNNWLSGKIPQIWDNLDDVDMSNNNLIGLLSNSNRSCHLGALKNCRYMVSLDIGDNQIFGSLPAWIEESMPNLEILRLRNNLFTGNIPSHLCSFLDLHILDLSKNNFSGLIPPCIGYMKGFQTISTTFFWTTSLHVSTKGSVLLYGTTQLPFMNSIDLSENALSGEIPANITSLLKLVSLNLSMNHLTGMIPSDIGSLTDLESLDLSVNRLSGPIPTSMTSLTFLSHLNLSHNNLSGFIPTGGQFQTFNDPSSYEGNAALCGIPLTTECFPGGKEEESQKHEEEEDDDLEKIELFVVVGLGIFTGFWGFLGTLIWKKNWRYAYFNFVERMTDKMYVMYFLLIKKMF